MNLNTDFLLGRIYASPTSDVRIIVQQIAASFLQNLKVAYHKYERGGLPDVRVVLDNGDSAEIVAEGVRVESYEGLGSIEFSWDEMLIQPELILEICEKLDLPKALDQ